MESVSRTSSTWVAPLDPETFAFVGFDELTRAQRRRISRLTIREGAPELTVVDNAMFDPGAGDDAGKASRFSGGVFDADGAPIAAAGVHRKGARRLAPSWIAPMVIWRRLQRMSSISARSSIIMDVCSWKPWLAPGI